MSAAAPPDLIAGRAGRQGVWPVLAALTGLVLALLLRLAVAGDDGAASVPAGVVFGVALLMLAAACGFRRPVADARQLGWGLAGSAILCAAPLAHRVGHAGMASPHGFFPIWAAVVTLVAVAEELLLRGALFEAADRWRGQTAAVALSAVAFGLLHVPLYGWGVLPLDLAVGVLLGALRVASGSVTAPALAHTFADVAGWWLR